MTKIDQILSSIESLPPFPEVAQRAMRAMEHPDCSARDLVHIIEYDQGITANILRICNSAHFGLPREIGSLPQAMSYIGQKTLLEIVLTSSIINYYKKPTPGYSLAKGELWRHSVACAILSQILGRKANKSQQPELFTAGLLHDIGKLVLSIFVKKDFETILELVESTNTSFLEAEREVIGLDHAQVGGEIVRKWNFPKMICMCVECHHNPDSIPDDDYLTPLVYIADIGCMFMGIGVGEDGLRYRCYPNVLKKCGIRQRDFELSLEELHEELGKIEKIIKV